MNLLKIGSNTSGYTKEKAITRTAAPAPPMIHHRAPKIRAARTSKVRPNAISDAPITKCWTRSINHPRQCWVESPYERKTLSRLASTGNSTRLMASSIATTPKNERRKNGPGIRPNNFDPTLVKPATPARMNPNAQELTPQGSRAEWKALAREISATEKSVLAGREWIAIGRTRHGVKNPTRVIRIIDRKPMLRRSQVLLDISIRGELRQQTA